MLDQEYCLSSELSVEGKLTLENRIGGNSDNPDAHRNFQHSLLEETMEFVEEPASALVDGAQDSTEGDLNQTSELFEQPLCTNSEAQQVTTSNPSEDCDISCSEAQQVTSNNPSEECDTGHIPLPGTKENPIHLIQEGNTYHSTQLLTQDQVQHVAQVLQHKMQNETRRKLGRTVLFNPLTNTRIVYKVVYPSDAQKEEKKPRGRKPAARNDSEGERKRHPLRTRSGRISKPPSYMVRDYKRIGHVNFNRSDAFSDYDVSDDDEENEDGDDDDDEMLSVSLDKQT